MKRVAHAMLAGAMIAGAGIVACGSQVDVEGAGFFSPEGGTIGILAPDAFAGPDADGVVPSPPSNVTAAPIALTATVSTLAGSGTAGRANDTGTAASFDFPSGVAVDAAGNVFVADRDNHLIRKITSAGVVSTFAGSGQPAFADDTGTAASFDSPTAIAIDRTGNLFVADRDNHRLRKITSAAVVSTVGDADSFTAPSGVAVDTIGNVYVSDGSAVRKVSAAGIVTTLADTGLANPQGLAVDGTGLVYVADRDNNRVGTIAADGTVSTFAGSGVASPVGLAVDATLDVYVAQGNRVQRIAPDRTVSTIAGADPGGYADGPGATALFMNPSGVAIGAKGAVYVADSAGQRVRKIATTGIGELTVTWLPSATQGSSAITGYTASAQASGHPIVTCTTTTFSCVLEGLTSGVSYTVSVTAQSSIGTSRPSPSANATAN